MAAGLATLLLLAALVVAACGGSSDSTTTQASAPTQTPESTTAPDTAAAENTGDTMQSTFMLSTRPGEKPNVTSGIPHIQLDQNSSDEMLDELATWAFSLDGVVERPSQASLPGAKGLTVARELPARRQAMIVGREFGHIHPGGSLHLRLPPGEAGDVVNRAWGEYHPFALDGTIPGLVMVYAPQTAEDLDVVRTIIEASVAFALSGDG
jgi:phospholipase/carboxylesterase